MKDEPMYQVPIKAHFPTPVPCRTWTLVFSDSKDHAVRTLGWKSRNNDFGQLSVDIMDANRFRGIILSRGPLAHLAEPFDTHSTDFI